MSNTMVAKAVGGRKGPKATPLLHPAPKDANQVRLKQPPLQSSSLLCNMNKSLSSSNNRNSSALLCSASLSHNSNTSSNSRTLLCSASLSHNSSTSSNSRNIKMKQKRKNSRKGTNNNSKVWKSADLIPNKSGQGI
jgi:hypothetical protein